MATINTGEPDTKPDTQTGDQSGKQTGEGASIESLKGEVSSLDAKLSQSKADAEKAAAAAKKKLDKQGKDIDRLKAENTAKDKTIAALEAQLKKQGASAGLEPGASFAVELVRAAPLGDRMLAPGAVIGTITPVEGANTNYVVDALRTNYAKSVPVKADAGGAS